MFLFGSLKYLSSVLLRSCLLLRLCMCLVRSCGMMELEFLVSGALLGLFVGWHFCCVSSQCCHLTGVMAGCFGDAVVELDPDDPV